MCVRRWQCSCRKLPIRESQQARRTKTQRGRRTRTSSGQMIDKKKKKKKKMKKKHTRRGGPEGATGWARRFEAPSRCAFSAVVNALPRCERIAVPCRSNGEVNVDVFHSSTPSSPVLIYLPPGPVIPESIEEEERVISALAATSGATIAKVNYRASSQHQFPTPVHDVLLGYDWVRENLLLDGYSRPVIGRVGVCGELVGGSLAVMLALTECRSGESRICAASVNNPIVDWVFPDDLPTVSEAELLEPVAPDETALLADEDPMALINRSDPKPSQFPKNPKGAGKSSLPTAWQLHGDNTAIPTPTLSAERDALFCRPEDYFDRFVSPIHFFRSPQGILLYPKKDDDWASEQPDSLLDIETQMEINHFKSFEESTSAPALPILARCRAYARIYPPAGSNLSLPEWRITAGLQSPLLDQASDLTRMIRRSVARQTLKKRMGRVRWQDAEEKEYYEKYASGRVSMETVDGVGLWTQQDSNEQWQAQVEQTGEWMKEASKPDSAY
ncbi:alpha/beta-hydrolase [Bimuria novae-zelandiae CBS 107.79]|uniref:Alpha/beta-hydrolase n=1 Tax=Bimuria novae-zelandiae CBS 107.79 TaxID=1447943 RepID=A0A6A5VKC6_9PLEO|nr:alpha/beta-hydrolase [Bimuria novae-zelandiae CBS 107.79]